MPPPPLLVSYLWHISGYNTTTTTASQLLVVDQWLYMPPSPLFVSHLWIISGYNATTTAHQLLVSDRVRFSPLIIKKHTFYIVQ